ncbi:type III polyketide synthase [Fluoribacter dumoffii]|uniref:Alpha-pyrone synthesis polyketide synthase-like Pks18 n=1 Tax=Fluoribacter dumoffii TaxID=463 RepID=A0A377G9Q6_9GAMM|nr:3-oxoacyl-[acyl-carrier-protein] synthase III C-terminal domain-containing protein [Fluoribacter dumoffii]KTC90324.1 Naringenin-chalcone synthase [Fluoribacter dumoffii NY 23]MCW8385641.1 type III polyketide synthase [Fluoribacter dumoffii]MCW8418670.1 type III polyketide synthase [Fluoribacter dumoffii]MCW8453486.1 type III polyketide synthase [Fluoribacter dumoffii]MCW8459294.1 type III polyketide synthase [Fluoribacter dumoffii]
MQSKITAIGIATPPFMRTQDEIAELISTGFHLDEAQKKILKKIYKSSGIETRHSVLTDYCKKPGQFEFFPNTAHGSFPSTFQRMQLYKDNALNLAVESIENCLNSINFDRSKITHLITVSCTGMYAPGIDIEIVQKLNLASSVKRTAINFMGCYGAFNGLKVANAFCQTEPHSNVLLVCVELCTIHFQNAFNIENIVSNAIFADGAATALIQAKTDTEKYFNIESFYCDLVPQTSRDMAWTICDYGFDIVLGSYVPEAIKSGILMFTEKLLEQASYSFNDIDFYAIHPGGTKILQACEHALNISPDDLQYSYEVLKRYGNMSSATVLFVLKKIWDKLNIQDKAKNVFSCAFGPGLTLESMILKIQHH